MVLHIGAALLFLSGRQRWALLTLLTGGVILRYYFATLDPFLHDWDERFHALVAKNLTQHWLRPTLIENPILGDDPHNWITTHIWLHKQPLFLWQMALSIKLFGATEFAVRLPSLIMTSILIPVIYQMGRMVFNPIAGFIAAFILSCYEPLLEMNSGMMGMDHNDIAFLFYVTLSIWAWICYERRQRTGYLMLIGFFAGCAVLCKWLTGMLVFSGFIFYHLLLVRDLLRWQTIRHAILAGAVAIAIFLPWQLCILHHYPEQARYEYAYNSRHFTQVLEGHRHEALFFFNVMPDYYQGWQYVLLLSLFVVLLFSRRFPLAASLAFMFAFVYLFFTLAQTKLQSYVMVVMPVGLLLIAAPLGWMLRGIWHMRLMRFISASGLFAGLLVSFIHWPMIRENHLDPYTWQGYTRAYKLQRASIFKPIASRLPSNAVLCSLEQLDNIDAMFYTGVPAFGGISESDYRLLVAQHYRAVFWGDKLPAYALVDTTAHLVRDYLPR